MLVMVEICQTLVYTTIWSSVGCAGVLEITELVSLDCAFERHCPELIQTRSLTGRSERLPLNAGLTETLP